MIWFASMQFFSMLLAWFWLGRKFEQEEDLEILLLRRQLEIVNRGRRNAFRLSRADKFTLTVLAARLKSVTGWPAKQFRGRLRLVQPKRFSNGIGSW